MTSHTTTILPGVSVEETLIAHQRLKETVYHTPLQKDERLSTLYDCTVYLKREDLQVVRSFKLRGAYNAMKSLSVEELQKGIVCASAGNHAQGVAYSCKQLQTKGKIFMPTTTPKQKINQVRKHGSSYVDIILTGDTFDDAYREALAYANEHNTVFLHPFDDEKVIVGQGTIAVEIMLDCDEHVDYIFGSVGGGGLLSGVSTYVKSISPATKIIAVEPKGAPALQKSLKANEVVSLEQIDKFVDGAAVQTIGKKTFEIMRQLVDDVVVVHEGKVCTSILDLYNENAIVVEPAGALSVAALDHYREQIRGKVVVCIISGGNNDIARLQEIKERSMIYEGLQHYFIVDFPQRAGALREFLEEVVGPRDDISRFEYTKKNNREAGPALVGIELNNVSDYEPLLQRMEKKGYKYIEVNKDIQLFNLLI